jgi:hypothetical protein
VSEEPVFVEEERQLILLALAHLAVQRPGWWHPALAGIAAKLDGVDLFDYFTAMAAPPPAASGEGEG